MSYKPTNCPMCSAFLVNSKCIRCGYQKTA